jgi:hypothetical protein
MANDIIAVLQDMTNMSARFFSDVADLKQLMLNVSANKRGRKKKYRQDPQRLWRKIEPTNQWKHMKILLTIWQLHGPTCVNLKTTPQIKIMFHKAIVHPARARLRRTDVCLTHHE